MLSVTYLGRYPQRTTERPVIMSTPRSETRKSASFKQESFEQEWQKLEQSAQAADAKRKPIVPKLELRDTNDLGSAAKTREKSVWESTQSDRSENTATTRTQTQTITTTQICTTTQTDSMAHAAPVLTPRKQLRFAAETNTDGGPRQEKTSARSEKNVDSPRRQKILSREPVQSKRSGSPSVSTTTTPSSSPAVTPRERDQSDSPRSVKANQLRKKISTKFSKVALNISNAIEELSPRKYSPTNSPASAGRHSPTKFSSRTPRRDWPADFTNAVCNQATKIIINLKKEASFQKVSPARQNLLIHAKLMEFMEAKKIPGDLKKLEILFEEVEKRSKNSVIDIEIDLTREPYLQAVDTIKQYLIENFGKSTDRGTLYDNEDNSKKQEMALNFESYFLRDMSGGRVKLEYEADDGKVHRFDSIWDLEKFLNEGDPESEKAKMLARTQPNDKQEVYTRSRYVSHFTSQHMFGFMGKVGLGMLSGFPSYIKLYDGTEIIPKGNVQIRYCFKKLVDGGLDVQIFYEMQADPERESNMKEGGFVSIDPDARLTLSMGLYFSRDRDLQTSAIRLHAEGWNLTVPGKYDKID